MILECHPRLTRLFSALPGVDRLVPPGSLTAGFDHHCSLMSLPGRLDVMLDNPAPPSRLTIPEAARRKAAATLATARSSFNVGIVWSGSATYKHNAKRTIAAKRFLPLARIPGVRLYSLYKGPLED
ncbi:MAG: hypothetical protein MI920_15020, partial [Kiloniellales bacterium]|nr:hypothetical protein [Kiloniellales bacterium]